MISDRSLFVFQSYFYHGLGLLLSRLSTQITSQLRMLSFTNTVKINQKISLFSSLLFSMVIQFHIWANLYWRDFLKKIGTPSLIIIQVIHSTYIIFLENLPCARSWGRQVKHLFFKYSSGRGCQKDNGFLVDRKFQQKIRTVTRWPLALALICARSNHLQDQKAYCGHCTVSEEEGGTR